MTTDRRPADELHDGDPCPACGDRLTTVIFGLVGPPACTSCCWPVDSVDAPPDPAADCRQVADERGEPS